MSEDPDRAGRPLIASMLDPLADGCGIDQGAVAGEVVRQLVLHARGTGDTWDRQVKLADGDLARQHRRAEPRGRRGPQPEAPLMFGFKRRRLEREARLRAEREATLTKLRAIAHASSQRHAIQDERRRPCPT